CRTNRPACSRRSPSSPARRRRQRSPSRKTRRGDHAARHISERTSRMRRMIVVGAVAFATTAAAQDRTMPPEAERQLARTIYKEMVEINSGYTTGATTPVVDAVAKRLKAAGFSAADIFVGGASPKKANLVVRYRGTGRLRPILL